MSTGPYNVVTIIGTQPIEKLVPGSLFWDGGQMWMKLGPNGNTAAELNYGMVSSFNPTREVKLVCGAVTLERRSA